MKLSSFLCVVALFLLASMVVILARAENANETGEGRNVRLPLDFDEKGRIRSQLFAGTATRDNGLVKAEDVRTEFYDVRGETEMSMEAEECTFDQSKNSLKSESKVIFKMGDSTITGKGLDWDGVEKRITILSDVRVSLGQSIKGMKRFGGLTGDGKSE